MPRMPTFVNDLGQVWSDVKGMAKVAYILLTDPKEAPPSTRKISVAFSPIVNATDQHMGCFVPELHELAKAGGLKWQIEEREWDAANPDAALALKQQQPFYHQLYLQDGTRRSAFHLALLPIVYDENTMSLDQLNKAARVFEKNIQLHYGFRMSRGLPLPPENFKYQNISDYLRGLGAIGMRAVCERDLGVNLVNPGPQTSRLERALHYTAQRLALVTTFATAFTVILGMAAPWAIPMAFVGTILAEWCAAEFGLYGAAEFALRNIGWMRSQELAVGDKISTKKLIKTAILTAALASGVAGAAFGGYALIMSLPLALPFGAAVATGLQTAVAAMVATATSLMAIGGGVTAIAFFWGFGIWDKQVDFTRENAAHFQPLRQETVVEYLARKQANVASKLARLNPEFANTAEAETVNQEFTVLRGLAQAVQPAPQPQTAAAANDIEPVQVAAPGLR